MQCWADSIVGGTTALDAQCGHCVMIWTSTGRVRVLKPSGRRACLVSLERQLPVGQVVCSPGFGMWKLWEELGGRLFFS